MKVDAVLRVRDLQTDGAKFKAVKPWTCGRIGKPGVNLQLGLPKISSKNNKKLIQKLEYRVTRLVG